MTAAQTRSNLRGFARSLLACGLATAGGIATAATVLDVDFSEVPLLTPDPIIEGAAFFAGDGSAFEDTITDDAVTPADPYLVSGVEGSGSIDLPSFSGTSFVGMSLVPSGSVFGGSGYDTLITLSAGFFQPLPNGETIRAEARLGGLVQQSQDVTTDTSDMQGFSILLQDLAFDALYLYVPTDSGASFRIDNLLVDVTSTRQPPQPTPIPGTAVLIAAGLLGLGRLAKRSRGRG